MSEFTTTRKIVLAATLGLGIAACSIPSPEVLNKTTLVQRYEFDYAGRTINGGEARKNQCMEDKAYDTEVYRGSSASAAQEGEDTLTVTPTAGGAVLRLIRIDGNQPLQPVDEASKGILQAYGCDTRPYAESEA